MSIESTNIKFFTVVLIKCSKSSTVFSLPKPVLWYQAKPKLKVCPFLFIVFLNHLVIQAIRKIGLLLLPTHQLQESE